MNVLTAGLVGAWRAAREWRLLAVLGLANLLSGLLFVAAWVGPVLAEFSDRPLAAGQPLASGPLILQLPRIARDGQGFPLGGLFLTLLFAGVLQSWLSGGIVDRVCTSSPFGLGAFCGACGRLWGRFLRLELWMLLGLVPVGLLVGGTAAWLHRVGRDSLFTVPADLWFFDRPLSRSGALHLAMTALLLGLWRASVELARVRIWQEDARKTRAVAWASVVRALRHPELAVGYLLLAAAGLLVVLWPAGAHARVDAAPGRALAAFALAQGVVLVRMWASVTTTAFLAAWAARPQASSERPVPTGG